MPGWLPSLFLIIAALAIAFAAALLVFNWVAVPKDIHITRSNAAKERLTNWEATAIYHSICPDCTASGSFYSRPWLFGTDYACNQCGGEFRMGASRKRLAAYAGQPSTAHLSHLRRRYGILALLGS